MSDNESKFAILMETSGDDCESWYYFIKYNGNEEMLKKIKDQLDMIENCSMMDGINIFDIDIENLVSEQTARELCMVELNSVTYHRKFNGKLKEIDFKLKDRYDDIKKMQKIYDVIGNGDIDEFIDEEEIPVSQDIQDDGYYELSSNDSDSGSDKSDEDDINHLDKNKLPVSLRNLKMNN